MGLKNNGLDIGGNFNPLVSPTRKPSALWVPKIGKTSGFYRDMPSSFILDTWGIGLTGIKHSKNTELSATKPLPESWRVEKFEDLPIWYVKDAKGHNRLKLNEYTNDRIELQILSPVVMRLTGDYETAEWVEILHHGEVIFTSPAMPTTIDFDDDEFPSVPELSEAEIEQNHRAVMEWYAPIYLQAENYIANYYPRVRDDPNAYW